MNIKQATLTMTSGQPLMYKSRPWYILFLDSIHAVCTLSNHPANSRGKYTIRKNIPIKDLPVRTLN